MRGRREGWRLKFQRLQFVEDFEMRDGLGQASEFVVCQCQVHAHLRIVGQLAQGLVVFIDGSGELAVADQRGAEVRADFGGVGIVFEKVAIEADGGGQVPGLERGVGFAQTAFRGVGPKGGDSRCEQQNQRGASHLMRL